MVWWNGIVVWYDTYDMIWYVWYGLVRYGTIRGPLDEGGDRWVDTCTTDTDMDRKTLPDKQRDKLQREGASDRERVGGESRRPRSRLDG